MGEKLITVTAYPLVNSNKLSESHSKCSVDVSM